VRKFFWGFQHLCHVCAVCYASQILLTTRRGWLPPQLLEIMTSDSARTFVYFFWLSSLQFVRLSKLLWAHQQAAFTTVLLYQPNCFSNSYSITTEKRFSKLQTEGLPIPSLDFRLARVEIRHKQMMLRADVQMYCLPIRVKLVCVLCVYVWHAGPVGRCSVHTTW
jgi:hypothetical protein